MTDDRLEELEAHRRKICNLENSLRIADMSNNPKAKLDAVMEVNGWLPEWKLKLCYDLTRPGLDAILAKLKEDFEKA